MSEQLLEVMLWLVAFLVIAGLFALMVRDSRRARARTVEEFEHDVEENRASLGRAGAMGLEMVLGKDRRAAIEYRQDQEKGTTRTGSKGDDAGRTSDEAR
jgi:hypothetical protein